MIQIIGTFLLDSFFNSGLAATKSGNITGELLKSLSIDNMDFKCYKVFFKTGVKPTRLSGFPIAVRRKQLADFFKFMFSFRIKQSLYFN